ncbi:amidase [Caballeronia sp. SEWSISQ10-4 2]|uniref:amidase n=1 Tax=Caballeronia sp. SEWSISQ10-4 2 TaxID=2937438 RepID=UPI00264BACA0|nr:amidase [Caballeronia sp. SEWSISQ10-4 2]MDN7182860.1 amidase [Caballeronia sp. SEWSISQ10-4 2]
MTATPTTDTAQDLLDALTFASAREQAAALADGRVSALDLLEHSLARIDRFDSAVNAIAVRDDEGARRAAREADAALARGERKPLLGVPITVKESFDVAGLVTSGGNPQYAGNRAERDSLAVAALREAGAVIIGKSNVPLANADLQSYNDVYGLTGNPWDLTRTPGGSSGGSAAALAAGYVALELGSDIGGSIRIPAHFTGVFGHKPSYGLVAMRGTGASGGRIVDRDLSVAGPLARSAADLELALDLLVNREPLAAKAWHVTLPPARQTRLRDFRVLVLDTWPGTEASLSERWVIERVVERLRSQGTRLSRVSDLPAGLLPNLASSHPLFRTLSGASLAEPPPLSARAQQRLKQLQPGDQSAEAARLRAPTLSHREWLKADEQRFALRHAWEKLFGSFDVVVTPVAPAPAFAHNHSEPKDERTYPVAYADGVRQLPFFELFYWAGLPVLPGLPATSFPLGLGDDGLPVSAQAVGAYLEDRTTVAFARAFEAAYGGFIAPPGYAGDNAS